MDLGPLRALALSLNFSAHGVPATVTRPNDVALDTTAIWLPEPPEAQPYGTDFSRREPRRLLALRRDATFAQLPRGTLIVAPEQRGGTARTWQVDGYQRTEADHWRVIVVAA
jgi:hypothetical protein